MNCKSLVTAVACLLSGSSLTAQSAVATSHSVSLYQLRHKSSKQARRFCHEAAVELKRKNYQAGLMLLQQALAADPDFWVAQNNLGVAFLHLRQLEKAQEAFQRAIEIDPMNATGYTNLSITALSRGDFSLAEQFASESLRLDPRISEARAMLGLALVAQGIWTPLARKLLEESRNISTSEALLKKWPNEDSPAPAVVVQGSGFH